MKPAVRGKGAPIHGEPFGVVIRLRPVLKLSPEQLLELSSLNDDLRLELTAEGALIAMPPTGWETGDREAELTMQLRLWAKQSGVGVATSSSTGFILPNGAIRSPDAAWVENSRLQALSAEQRRKYLPLCPDFVVELRSPSDRLSVVQEKMQEYMENGARLGLLLDPADKRVYVYEPGKPVREFVDPEEIPGDPVLPGFVLKPREVW